MALKLCAGLGETKYVASDNCGVADIKAFVTVDFAGWVKVSPEEKQINLKRWHDELDARSSAMP